MHQLHRNRRQPAVPCNCLRPVIRIFGIITSFVICGVGVDVYLHGYKAGLFIIISSVFVLFLEIKWIITIFLKLLVANNTNSFWLRCWSWFRMTGGWYLAPPYIALGVALMIWPHNLWLSYVAGVLLIAQAGLRLCTLIRFSKSYKDDRLLSQNDFQNFDGYAEVPTDSFAELQPSLEDEEPIDDVC